MATVNLLEVEVVYALSHEQILYSLDVPTGSTVRDAIVQSGVLSRFPDVNLESIEVGIFSRSVDLNVRVKSGDRIEIYRPLILSPSEARRLRADRKKL